MPKHNPQKYYSIAAIISILLLSGLLYYWNFNIIYAYLLSISIITFLFYRHDKKRAVNNKGRIPEIVLHLLALIGGTIGALLGQISFKHKTRKFKFRIIFKLIIIVQVIAIYLYYKNVK